MIEDYTVDYDTKTGRAYPRDMVPAKDARILWNEDITMHRMVRDVMITYLGEVHLFRHIKMSGGACHMDWLNKDAREGFVHLQAFTPAGQFGTLMAQGFTCFAEMRRAVYQFARIEGCEFAQRMLYAIDSEWEPERIKGHRPANTIPLDPAKPAWKCKRKSVAEIAAEWTP